MSIVGTAFVVVALSASEARAIVREPTGYFSVQSPYQAGDRYPVSEQTLHSAIRDLGFEPVELCFSQWAEVTAHIDAANRAFWGRTEPESAEAVVSEALQHAPAWVVCQFLDALWAAAETSDPAMLTSALALIENSPDAADEAVRAAIQRLERSIRAIPPPVCGDATRVTASASRPAGMASWTWSTARTRIPEEETARDKYQTSFVEWLSRAHCTSPKG